MPTIIDGTTGASQIQNGTVTVNKIANGAVTETKIADGAVTAAKLAVGVISTTSVLAATAGASAGAVGTYAMLRYESATTPILEGTTLAGSELRYANVAGNSTGTTPTGTWRIMGQASNSSATNRTSLWLRIS